MYDDEFRRHLAELYREDDRLRAEWEHEERLARQEARASPLVRQTAPVTTSPHDDGDDALQAAPAPQPETSDEEPCFTEEQFDTLAFVLNELRKQWQGDIERAQQRILQAVVRAVLPGELAEREVHDLRARVIRAEQHIERQLKAAIGDDKVVDLPAGFIRRRGHAA